MTDPIDERPTIRFTLELGQALHRFGAPSHRIEDAMTHVSQALGRPGVFFVSPTSILASFDEDGTTRFIRGHPADLDLGRMAQVDVLIGRVVRGERGAVDGIEELRAILAPGPRYGAVVTILAFGVSAAGASRFFSGGLHEVIAALVVGILLGTMIVGAGRAEVLRRLFNPLAAFLATVVAYGASAVWPGISILAVSLGGLIVLLPGLSLTIAMTELATGHLMSGTARVTGALMVFLSLGLGVALGTKVGAAVFGPAPAEATVALPWWTVLVALASVPPAFTVLFRARVEDMGWIALACFAAFGGARLGALVTGPELGTFVGAVLLGITSNAIARLTDRPAAVTLVPAMMLLVPGSVGFRSLSSLLARDVVSGMELAFTMTLVAVALVTGLLVANAVISPRRAL